MKENTWIAERDIELVTIEKVAGKGMMIVVEIDSIPAREMTRTKDEKTMVKAVADICSRIMIHTRGHSNVPNLLKGHVQLHPKYNILDKSKKRNQLLPKY
jgi:hypothetical protein